MALETMVAKARQDNLGGSASCSPSTTPTSAGLRAEGLQGAGDIDPPDFSAITGAKKVARNLRNTTTIGSHSLDDAICPAQDNAANIRAVAVDLQGDSPTLLASASPTSTAATEAAQAAEDEEEVIRATEAVWLEAEAWVEAEARAEEEAWAELLYADARHDYDLPSGDAQSPKSKYIYRTGERSSNGKAKDIKAETHCDRSTRDNTAEPMQGSSRGRSVSYASSDGGGDRHVDDDDDDQLSATSSAPPSPVASVGSSSGSSAATDRRKRQPLVMQTDVLLMGRAMHNKLSSPDRKKPSPAETKRRQVLWDCLAPATVCCSHTRLPRVTIRMNDMTLPPVIAEFSTKHGSDGSSKRQRMCGMSTHARLTSRQLLRQTWRTSSRSPRRAMRATSRYRRLNSRGTLPFTNWGYRSRRRLPARQKMRIARLTRFYLSMALLPRHFGIPCNSDSPKSSAASRQVELDGKSR